jgi:hypothetical protein
MPSLPTSLLGQSGQIGFTRYTLTGPDGSTASIAELRTGFRQGFVFELLDLTRPLIPLEVHVMVLNPVKYTLSEPFQLTLTPGEDDTVVAEENGIIVREVMLEGTYGIQDKRAQGFIGAQGGGQALSGNAHFNALRNMFRRYSAIKKDPRRAANVVMIFHALRATSRRLETLRRPGRTTSTGSPWQPSTRPLGLGSSPNATASGSSSASATRSGISTRRSTTPARASPRSPRTYRLSAARSATSTLS